MVQETARQPAKATKDRKPVQVRQDLDSKVVRCLYTDESRREDSNRNSKTIVAINLGALERFEDGATVSVDTLIESGIVKTERRSQNSWKWRVN